MIAAIIVIVVSLATSIVVPGLLVAMAIEALIGAAVGGVIGGIISAITGGSFWEGFKNGAFYGAIGGAIGGAMSFVFTGVVWGAVLTLKQLLLIGGVSAMGSVWVGDLGDIVFKGVKMSLKEILTDVVVAGGTGVVFAGIAYGLSKAFAALKLKIINKDGSNSVLENVNYAQKSYSNTFSAEGRKIYSSLAGEPINKGKVNVADLPVEYIVRDGNILILNTRTSQALTQAGIPRSQWNVINRTGDSLFEELLTGQLTRNKLTSEGISTVKPSGGK